MVYIAAEACIVNSLSSAIAGACSIQASAFAAGHAAVHAVCAFPAGRQLVQAAFALVVCEASTAGRHFAQSSLCSTPRPSDCAAESQQSLGNSHAHKLQGCQYSLK